MRNSLLSIGEAAKLKNVSIKALRYYEKLGIFNPAYIDPQSGYRYYSPAQLFDLDVILTCGELGIPLKHILDYQTEQGTIDLRQLLIEGSELAEQKIKRARQSLLQINTYLEEIEQQDSFRHCPNTYTRTMPSRYFCAKPWDISRPFEIKNYLKTMSDLYQLADELGTTPLYFQGLLIDTTSTEKTSSCQAYVAVDLYPSKSDTNLQTNEADIKYLPEDTYTGFRIENNDLTECITTALTYAKEHPGFFVMTEIWDAELAANTFIIELLQSGKILNVSVPD
ncbi:transcriptional regulator MerR family [Eggerthella sp. CAG:1427]|nr:transcriptional regulator MerR family [Eggerthella sp. CAG:1427]